MKIFCYVLTICLLTSNINCIGQPRLKELPVIKAKTVRADYKIGNDRINGSWRIAPEITCDSLFVTCFNDSYVPFTFYTDFDSISFDINPNTIHEFYISLGDTTYAHTLVKGVKPRISILTFDIENKNPDYIFWYEDNRNNKYLDSLRAKYPIDNLIQNAKNDTEKAQLILNWVHRQWRHNGNNVPIKNDAISILDEAKTGKMFRCVEYGIVASACMNAAGLKARTLSLKTKDVETTKSGAGHVLLEVFLNDLDKWVLLDGQWDIMPVLNNVPLNAIEFQQAITENYQELEIWSMSGISKRMYVSWIYPYLYYFSFNFDNREGIENRKTVNNKNSLMLVPLGAKNPTIFQIINKINNCVYTNSLLDFYRKP